jgi:uncharacterized protein (TIGR03083 family)
MAEPLPEIACENCVAACCKAPVFMQLTQKEFDRHHPKMDLRVIKNPLVFAQRVELPEVAAEPQVVQPGYGLFLLASGCANLDKENRCSVYDDRPGCCRAYELGSAACLGARRKAGLDADRPLSEVETAPASVTSSDPVQRLVRQFFPAPVDRSETTPSSVSASEPAPSGLFDLGQLSASVSRETRWISEQLAGCETWSRRTRLPGLSIGAVAAHLVDGLHLADAVMRGAIEGHGAKSPDDFRGDRAATVREFAAAADAVRVSLDQLTPAVAARDVIIDDEARVTAHNVIEVLVMELAVHGLDLADALGETRSLSPEAIDAIVRVLPELLDPGVAAPKGTAYVLRSSAFEMPFTWQRNAWTLRAGPDPCAIEGEPEAVLLFALGRVPFDKSSLVTDRPELARAFKRYLVGP